MTAGGSAGGRLRARLAAWRSRGRVTAGAGAALGRGVRIRVARGGCLRLGERAVLGDRCRVDVAAGAVVDIGPGARLGDACALAVRAGLTVGADARIGDEVAFVDHGPRYADSETPTRLQGVDAVPITVGAGATVGPAAVLDPGAVVAEGAVILARSVVGAPRRTPPPPR